MRFSKKKAVISLVSLSSSIDFDKSIKNKKRSDSKKGTDDDFRSIGRSGLDVSASLRKKKNGKIPSILNRFPELASECFSQMSGGALQRLRVSYEYSPLKRRMKKEDPWQYDTVPQQVLLHIASFLTTKDLCSLLQLNHTWFDFIDNATIWKNLLTETFNRPENLITSTVENEGTSWRQLYMQHVILGGITVREAEKYLQLFPSTPDYEHDKSGLYVRMLEYHKRSEQIDDAHKAAQDLLELHISLGNFNEAAIVLLHEASVYNWSKPYKHPRYPTASWNLPAIKDVYPAESLHERKTRLLLQAAKCFSDGKYYERGIEVVRELRIIHEENKSFKLYQDIAEKEKTMQRDLETKERFFEEFFFVEFHGKGWLKDLLFVYKGAEVERIGDFAAKVRSRFPGTKIIHSQDVPTESGQYAHVRPCKPIDRLPKLLAQEHNIAQGFVKKKRQGDKPSFDVYNDVNMFMFSRPFKKGKSGANEFEDLWIQKTFLITRERFPHMQRRSEVVKIIQLEIGPVANAGHMMKDKNRQLEGIINRAREKGWVSGFSMSLNGVVDAAVSGGVSMFAKFLSEAFVQENPQEAQNVGKLQSALLHQSRLLTEGLSLHKTIMPPQMSALHTKMETFYEKWKIVARIHDPIQIERQRDADRWRIVLAQSVIRRFLVRRRTKKMEEIKRNMRRHMTLGHIEMDLPTIEENMLSPRNRTENRDIVPPKVDLRNNLFKSKSANALPELKVPLKRSRSFEHLPTVVPDLWKQNESIKRIRRAQSDARPVKGEKNGAAAPVTRERWQPYAARVTHSPRRVDPSVTHGNGSPNKTNPAGKPPTTLKSPRGKVPTQKPPSAASSPRASMSPRGSMISPRAPTSPIIPITPRNSVSPRSYSSTRPTLQKTSSIPSIKTPTASGRSSPIQKPSGRSSPITPRSSVSPQSKTTPTKSPTASGRYSPLATAGAAAPSGPLDGKPRTSSVGKMVSPVTSGRSSPVGQTSGRASPSTPRNSISPGNKVSTAAPRSPEALSSPRAALSPQGTPRKETPRSISSTTRRTPITPQNSSTDVRVGNITPRSSTAAPRSTTTTPRSTLNSPRSTTLTPRSTVTTPRSSLATPRSTTTTPRSTTTTPRRSISGPVRPIPVKVSTTSPSPVQPSHGSSTKRSPGTPVSRSSSGNKVIVPSLNLSPLSMDGPTVEKDKKDKFVSSTEGGSVVKVPLSIGGYQSAFSSKRPHSQEGRQPSRDGKMEGDGKEKMENVEKKRSRTLPAKFGSTSRPVSVSLSWLKTRKIIQHESRPFTNGSAPYT
ncbi:hypothetical protein PROFUN_00376 [Planoprotostelium fungivorum]|uniref:F-box domain-containing protein n=1 Tax=Planoprotostelium fungivorum TaxID=1890364 RepID=A0A2P6NYA8_9EUKA|nr:hypothetical protein PROFUN_00376 [Planoprotostelium fungivorum]